MFVYTGIMILHLFVIPLHNFMKLTCAQAVREDGVQRRMVLVDNISNVVKTNFFAYLIYLIFQAEKLPVSLLIHISGWGNSNPVLYPATLNKCGGSCYTLRQKIAFECPSVCLSIRPSVRPSALGSYSLPDAFFNQFSSNLV